MTLFKYLPIPFETLWHAPSATPTHIVDEALDLGLHAPVSELHLAEFVGAHDGTLAEVVVDLLNPVVWQRAPLGLGRLVELGIFLRQVLVGRNVVLHDVDRVYRTEGHTRMRGTCDWTFLVCLFFECLDGQQQLPPICSSASCANNVAPGIDLLASQWGGPREEETGGAGRSETLSFMLRLWVFMMFVSGLLHLPALRRTHRRSAASSLLTTCWRRRPDSPCRVCSTSRCLWRTFPQTDRCI